MEQYQQRVVNEQMGLVGKLVKLVQFTATDMYRSLSDYEKGLLEDQIKAMLRYSDILGRRIEQFGREH